MKIKIVLCLCMALCLTALGVSGYIIWNDYAQRQGDQQEFEELSRQTTLRCIPFVTAKEPLPVLLTRKSGERNATFWYM